jgi:hypothetical protein
MLQFLTFMGACIVRIFQYISNKMQRYTVYSYLETALPVSGATSNHHQEHIQLYLQHLVFVTPLLLPAAIVEEMEFQLFHAKAAGSSNGVTNTRCCKFNCMRSWWWVVVPPETCRAVSRWNKLCNVASCWIYIETLRNCWHILYFRNSKIKFLMPGTRIPVQAFTFP